MVEPTTETQVNDKKDKTATAYLFQSLPEDQILHVANCKSAKEIWDTLKTRNIGVDRVQKEKLQTLKSEFKILQMEKDDTIDSFNAKMTSITSKMTSLGSTLDESTRVRKLLNFVLERFIQIVASIEQYSDLDKMTLDEAIGRGRYIPPHSRNRDDNRQHGKEENFSQDYNEAMKKPRDFSKVKCYNCNEYGHYASHCHKRDRRQQRQEASNLVEEDLEPTLLMASTSFNKTQRKSSKDTPTNESIWFAKDYDDEDSKFREIILEEDEEGHDQDYDKLNFRSNSYAMHGQCQEALQLFSDMCRMHTTPTFISFIGILSACPYSGLVSIGKVAPDPVIWGTLLDSCTIHKNVHLAEEIVKFLVDNNLANLGTYILLSNLYAANANSDGVAQMRTMMKHHGVHKEPGCSSTEVHNKVHEFVAGDMKHPNSKKIYMMLEEVNGWLKDNGYSPETDIVLHDFGNKDRARSLEVHSEKLAVAFGLISTEAGSSIKIVKNLRICLDCHEVMKLISNITRRRIVIRDRNRFHHFADGLCSCGDYW
ncbi:pentatricopeptide repeat-containing protein ELI1, chloroplastic [Tanacetum coccineum]